MGRILLVEPDFPIPQKSKNHKNFLPIGLLKIASFLRAKSTQVQLVRGYPEKDVVLQPETTEFNPTEVWVTSLFTYWSKYVKDTVQYYKSLFPNAKIVVGGIYASLMPRHCKEYTGCHEVYSGVMKEAEKFFPAYDLIKDVNPRPIDYQIIHASRGCPRKCPFCGAWKIEPKFEPKKSIKEEIKSRKIVLYDNNFLDSHYVENILQELIDFKKAKKIDWCESQSGFDGRILLKRPYLAKMIKDAGFRYPRIAWDWNYSQAESVKNQIDLLLNAGYQSKEIYVFMLYNWDISFGEMERKRIECWKWGIQIADCRYRPLDQTYDNYDPKAIGQTPSEYYIHENAGWTDILVKQFRRNIRRQNICVRHGFPFYSKTFERKGVGRDLMRETKSLSRIQSKVKFLVNSKIDYWFPDKITYPDNTTKKLCS